MRSTVQPARDAVASLFEPPPPRAYLIEGLLQPGQVTMIVGPTKARKSFLALQLALCLASGTDFLGQKVHEPVRVLYVNLENSEDEMHERAFNMARRLNLQRERLEGNYYLANCRGMVVATSEQDMAQLLNPRGKGASPVEFDAKISDMIASAQPDVVLIDPIYCLNGGIDECDRLSMNTLRNFVISLSVKENCSVVFVHHDGKGDSGDRNIRDRGSGTSVINRGVNNTIAISLWEGSDADPEKNNLAVLSLLCRGEAPRADTTIHFDKGAFFKDAREAIKTKQRVGRPQTPEISDEAVLNLMPDYGIPYATFLDLVKNKLYIGRDKAYKKISEMATKGLFNISQAGTQKFYSKILLKNEQ